MPRSPRLLATLLLLLLRATSSCCAQELLVNGDFTSWPLDSSYTAPVTAASGSHARVGATPGGMEPFPGGTSWPRNSAWALQLSPVGGASSTTATIATALATRVAGWYKVTFFLFVPASYNGRADAVLADVTGSSGASAPASSTPVALKSPRGEWLQYKLWVPSNTNVASAARVAIDTGPGHSSGPLQVTGVSVEFRAGGSGSGDAELGMAYQAISQLGSTSLAQKIDCTGSLGAGECTAPVSEVTGAITNAIDGDKGTNYWVYPNGLATVALEISLGETLSLCGLEVVFPGVQPAGNSLGTTVSYPRCVCARVSSLADPSQHS